jgi:hypothetical protein
MPKAHEVVCVILVKGVLIHNVGVLDGSDTVGIAVTVMILLLPAKV